MICPCGCGATFAAIGTRGRPRSYFSPACALRVNRVSGGGEGRRHSAETRAILSAKASVPRPWLRGTRNGMAGRTGSSNPNWRGGSSPERQRLYAGAAWRQLRRTVIARDIVCTRCQSSSSRHLHHVKSWATHPDLRFDPDNVVLLCRDCHHNAHRKEVGHQYGAVHQ
jgi:hypothetical protein